MTHTRKLHESWDTCPLATLRTIVANTNLSPSVRRIAKAKLAERTRA